jgi:hypothetical protein
LHFRRVGKSKYKQQVTTTPIQHLSSFRNRGIVSFILVFLLRLVLFYTIPLLLQLVFLIFVLTVYVPQVFRQVVLAWEGLSVPCSAFGVWTIILLTSLFMSVLSMTNEVLFSAEKSFADRALEIFDMVFGVFPSERGILRLAFLKL